MSLQLRLSKQELTSHLNEDDITKDLVSLSFENALNEEEQRYLPLRARHHAFTVASCAHATYIVSMLNELRQVLSDIRNPINKRTQKFYNKKVTRNPLKVGLIGCGRLGKQIVSSLLQFGNVRPGELLISTRRPDSLTNLARAGIKCVFNNRHVVASCNIVFLCCLPSSVAAVASDIAGYIAPDCLVFSFVIATALPRLQQLLQHSNLAKMDFTWSMKNSSKEWKLGCDVTHALEDRDVAELVCPLSSSAKKNGIVWTSAKTVEVAIYAAFNMCPSLEVTCEEAVAYVNNVFVERDRLLTWHHFLDDDAMSFIEQGNLPIFDIFHISTQDSPFTKTLDDQQVRQLLTKKFLQIFNKLTQVDRATPKS